MPRPVKPSIVKVATPCDRNWRSQKSTLPPMPLDPYENHGGERSGTNRQTQHAGDFGRRAGGLVASAKGDVRQRSRFERNDPHPRRRVLGKGLLGVQRSYCRQTDRDNTKKKASHGRLPPFAVAIAARHRDFLLRQVRFRSRERSKPGGAAQSASSPAERSPTGHPETRTPPRNGGGPTRPRRPDEWENSWPRLCYATPKDRNLVPAKAH